MIRNNYTLINDRVRANAIAAIKSAPDGFQVSITEPKRNLDQNAKFHSICSDIAKSGMQWGGKRRSADEWKVLLVSGHTKATKGDVEFIPGLEGEFVNVRESTANMGIKRAASLIEYSIAFCASNNIELHDTRRGGFLEDRRAA